MAKQIKLEIARENPDAGNWLYADLQLPAEEHEIRDAFQRARITDSDTFYELSAYECEALPLLPFRRLDTTTVDEMNFLAKRLDGLNEDERLVLQAVSPRILKYGEDEIISIKDLINLTYGLDEVSIISNVSNPHELGQFVIENDLHRDVETVPEEAVYLLRTFLHICDEISGQVIMTTHNTTLMETDFARDATYVINENEDGRVTARAISEYDKRTYVSNNIRNKYLNNHYEGVPKVTKIEFAPLVKVITDAIS